MNIKALSHITEEFLNELLKVCPNAVFQDDTGKEVTLKGNIKIVISKENAK